MIQQDNGLRRRESDFQLHPSTDESILPAADRRHAAAQPQRKPSRAFLRKFRHPIIGLSLAGVAAPLINAQGRPPVRRLNEQATTSQPTEADLARSADTAQQAGMDAEDVLAAKIATEHHGELKSSIVAGAIDRYRIDEALANDIYEIARQEGIEPELAYGLVKTESSFRQRAESHVGARGLTQVMPRTARWLVPGTNADDLYDRKVNLKLGFRYLNQLIDKYRGDVKLALTAYNRGPGTVDKVLKRGGDPDNGYAGKVMGG